MNTAKLLVIIKREYLTRVKSKGFVLGTLLTPLLLASLLLLLALLMGRGSRTDYRVVILDQTGDVLLYERAVEILTTENARGARFQVRREAVSEIQSEARRQEQELNRELREGKLDSYLVVPAAVLDEGKIAYYAKNTGDVTAETRVENAFNTAVTERRMTRSGLDVEQIGKLSRKIIMEKFNERGEGADWLKIIMAFSLMGVLCLTVLGYGAHLTSAVIEEKQSRIIEVLLSSVEPFPLMLGKLVGVGLVGLTQYAIWGVCAVLVSSLAAAQSPASGSFRLPHIPVSLVVYFVVFFMLGYFLYATLFVVVGAMVSNEEDGQQMQVPLMILILLAPVASSLVWRQPDSALRQQLRYFHFSVPLPCFFGLPFRSRPRGRSRFQSC